MHIGCGVCMEDGDNHCKSFEEVMSTLFAVVVLGDPT